MRLTSRSPMVAMVAMLVAGLTLAVSAQSPDITVGRIVVNEAFREGLDFLAADHDRFIRETAELAAIPAAAGAGKQRVARFVEMARAAGIDDATVDDNGNVILVLRGRISSEPLVVVDAPLGTSMDTDPVTAAGTRIEGPGVAGARGLASLLAVLRALKDARIQPRRDLMLLASAPGSGAGPSEGIRKIFDQPDVASRARYFVALEGTGSDRVSSAPGTRGSTIVHLASQMIQRLGQPEPAWSDDGHRDATVPIGLKVPAITIGSGGEGGQTDDGTEWIDLAPETSVPGIQAVFGIVLAMAEIG